MYIMLVKEGPSAQPALADSGRQRGVEPRRDKLSRWVGGMGLVSSRDSQEVSEARAT